MSLDEEITNAKKQIITDGYEMSVGEIINLYRDKELVIDPVFQRLFRWDDERKTRFIESLILGIPVPSIFVYQNNDGIWELVDGLQRISTILQLTGDLQGERAKELGELILNGTRLLPSLNGKRWKSSSTEEKDGLGQTLQIVIKRARMRVEILKSESDISAKFELFQRLNTGGARLSEQEVRNSIAVSLNREFYDWLVICSNNENFTKTTNQTRKALDSQFGVELALRFFSFRNIPYKPGLDIHEYLDDSLIKLATDPNFNMDSEGKVFRNTFKILHDALENHAFKKWDGTAFKGMFLMSVFEVLAIGVSKNLSQIQKLQTEQRNSFIEKKAQDLWSNSIFQQNSGAGVRGTTRLSKLLPIADDFLRP